jgi:trimethylamine--corrinoid protein Co-methyltransferase
MKSETSSGARIRPIKIKPEMRIKTLNDENLEKIHQATLAVLKETGVRFPSEKALHIFAQAGANVDFKTQTVKIQPDLLMKALAKAPAKFVMGSRGNQDLDVILDGARIYCGTTGTGTTTVDLESRKQRASTKEDIAMMALISDYLSSVSFYWPMVAARDCPPEIIALHELEASFTHTQKHVQIVSCVEEKTAQFAVADCKPHLAA